MNVVAAKSRNGLCQDVNKVNVGYLKRGKFFRVVWRIWKLFRRSGWILMPAGDVQICSTGT